MISVQSLLSFVLWITLGVFLARRSQATRRWVFGMSRRRLAVYAAGLFVVPSALLMALLLLMAGSHALTPSGMRTWAWVAVTAAGLGYVYAQSLATAMLVSLAHPAVTPDPRRASEIRDSVGNDSDEASLS